MKQVLGYIPWLVGYPSPRPRKISIDMEAVVSAWVGCALRSLQSGMVQARVGQKLLKCDILRVFTMFLFIILGDYR